MEIIEIARMQNEIECYLKGCVHGYIERGLLTMGFTQYQIDHAIGKGWLKVLAPGQTVHDWEMGVDLESSADEPIYTITLQTSPLFHPASGYRNPYEC